MGGEGEDPERAVGEQQQQDLVLGLGLRGGFGFGFGLGVGVGFEQQQQQDLAAERGGGDGSCWVGGVVVDAPTEGDPL